MERLSYRPQVDMQQLYAFDERLRNMPGSWNTIGKSFIHAGSPGVIHLRWLIDNQPWCTESGFLSFLDAPYHRLLLRCFLRQGPTKNQQQPDRKQTRKSDAFSQLDRKQAHTGAISSKGGWQRIWKEEALLEQIHLTSKQQQKLMRALHFLEIQEYIVARDSHEWMSGPFLEHIENFDATFAWCVQAHLQNHQALTRRGISFKEWQAPHLNTVDILAFTADGLSMIVDCEASQHVPLSHLEHFVRRTQAFPADISLLFIDTMGDLESTGYLQQINILLKRDPLNFGHRYLHNDSVVYRLTDHLYVANTAGGIEPVLEITLRSGSNFKKGIADTEVASV